MLKNFIQQTTECLPGTGNASYQLTIEEYFLSLLVLLLIFFFKLNTTNLKRQTRWHIIMFKIRKAELGKKTLFLLTVTLLFVFSI